MTYTLKLSGEMLQFIIDCIETAPVPRRASTPVINEIQKQVNAHHKTENVVDITPEEKANGVG